MKENLITGTKTASPMWLHTVRLKRTSFRDGCVSNISILELAHQWFGNLVTMDWWNELWLNEGFATWVGWLAVDHFYPGESPIKHTLRRDINIYRMERLVSVCCTQCPRYSPLALRSSLTLYRRLKVCNKHFISTLCEHPTPSKYQFGTLSKSTRSLITSAT